MAARGVGAWGASRASLGRELCARDGWRNARGALCAASARKALPRLAAALGLSLPPAQPGPLRRGCGPAACASGLPLTAFSGAWRRGRSRCQWRTRQRSAGCVVVFWRRPPAGSVARAGLPSDVSVGGGVWRVGGSSFVSAPLRASRRVPGWDERGGCTSGRSFQRPAVAFVRVPHLASHVLGRAVGRLASDWSSRHGVRPVLVETCVEARVRRLPCAGWECVGRTAGRPPGSAPVAPKGVWLRGLESGWAETLRRPAVRAPGSYPALGAEDASCWARPEFGRSDLADGRLRSRRGWAGPGSGTGAPLPAVFPGSADQQAASFPAQ